MKEYKLLIIGAGPSGISLASEARKAGLKPHEILILDKAEAHSWVIRSLYPDNKIVTANYKGMPAVCHGVLCLSDSTKDEAINFLDKAIIESGAEVNYNEEVLKIAQHYSGKDQYFTLNTNKSEYKSLVVVIAIGIFGKPNKPNYELPFNLKSKIHFDITSFDSVGESILVVGGGDSASEFVQFLVEKSNKITLSYRGKEFNKMNDINKDSILQLKKSRLINVLLESNIKNLTKDDDSIIVRFEENAIPGIKFDRVVYALGGSTPENFLKSTGILFEDDRPKINENGETNIPALFIGGDLLAGKKGGSIAHAFNSSRQTMTTICQEYLHCKIL